MDDLMGKNDLIQNLPPFNITCFLLIDKDWEERFEAIGNKFGYDFADHIT